MENAMADETQESREDREAAEKAAAEHAAEQDRLLALSHADDRPAVSIAALAPRNRPVDAERRVVQAPEVRSADDFSDPARGLEPTPSDVENVRRTEGSEAGDEAASKVLEGDVPPTPSESVPDDVKGPPAAERHQAEAPKGKAPRK